MKFTNDPNYEKWRKDFQSRQESYPYVFSDYNEAVLAFWHSDDNRPYLTVATDSLFLYEDGCIEIYSRDYDGAVATIWSWDYWKIVEKETEYPDKLHESHKSVRSSDASTFDMICDDCGATDRASGGWGKLKEPCSQPKLETNPGIGNLCMESVAIDSDGYIIWNGGADRPVPDDTIVQVKIRSGLYRSPIDALYWPQICWRHRGKDDPKNIWDIVAYKVIENDNLGP